MKPLGFLLNRILFKFINNSIISLHDRAFNTKPYLVMRLTVLLILFGVFQVTAGAYSQSGEFSLDAKNRMVKDVLSEIQDKSDYRFFYSDDMIDLNQKVTIQVKNSNIESLMKELAEKTDISYKIMEDNLIVISPSAISEAIIVTGIVTSETDQSPLPGVNVIVKGTNVGTITDINGKYTLEMESGDAVLIFSFVGYESKEVLVGSQTSIDVVLAESTKALDEVVVTALNIERDKNSLGYSVTQVSGEELDIAIENNVVNSLSGRVAGLQITRSPTGVDGSTRVVLRGISSLLGNNRPLFVIDGIPVDASYSADTNEWGGRDMGDALSDINPEDIESVNVLKGAGAAAAYGSRGANGVVLITTKNGAGSTGLNISFSSTYAMEEPMVYPDLQNEYGTGGFGVYPPVGGDPARPDKNDPWSWSYGPSLDGEVRTDWAANDTPFLPQDNPLESFLRNGSSFINSLAIESGNDKSSFRASITTQNSKGLYPTNDLKRQTFNVRGFTKATDYLELDAKITYIHSKVQDRPYMTENGANAGLTLTIMPRNIGTDDLRENRYDENDIEQTWTNDNTYNNAYWALENIKNWDERNRMQSMLSMKFKFLKSFSFLVRTGLDFRNSVEREWGNQGSPRTARGRGFMNHNSNNRIEWNSDFLLTYANNSGDFIYDINLGGNYRYNQYKSIEQSGEGMKVPDFFHISNYTEYRTGEGFWEKAVYSLYGLGQLSYKSLVYFDFSVRNDWSSTLPPETNSYLYYAGNLSFMFSNLFATGNVFSAGKLRGSYAVVGNDTGPYETIQYYSIDQTPLPYPMGNLNSQLAFFDFMPEQTESWEIGTNLDFFNSRLVLDLTYYNSYSRQQIMNVPLLPSTGYSNKKMNAGEIHNNGIEIQLNGVILQRPNFQWDMVVTFTKNKSMVTKLYEDLENVILNDLWHASIQAIPGEEYGVIVGIDYKRDVFGDKMIDENGFAQKGDITILGSINPDFLMGVSSVFSYKNFTFSFLIDMQKGAEIYSWGKAYKTLYGTAEETLEGRAEWYATHDPEFNYQVPLQGVEPQGYIESGVNEQTGEPNDIPIQPIYKWFNLWNNTIVTESILDATNVRMREMILSYALPASVLNRSFLNNLVISLTSRNVFFFYRNAPHIDPESGYSSGNTSVGFEHSSLPSTRSYGVQLRVNF